MLTTTEIQDAEIWELLKERNWHQHQVRLLKKQRGQTVARRMETTRDIERRENYLQLLTYELAARANAK